jgi:hypothetical protein
MIFKVTYTVPFSADPEIRQQLFEEQVNASDSQSARKKIYKKHHNANILSLDCISYF